jgi:hypothetical protein
MERGRDGGTERGESNLEKLRSRRRRIISWDEYNLIYELTPNVTPLLKLIWKTVNYLSIRLTSSRLVTGLSQT